MPDAPALVAPIEIGPFEPASITLTVLADAPLPGRCLPALLSSYAAEWIVGLSAAMLRDTLDGLQALHASDYVVVPSSDDEAARTALERHLPLPWQLAASDRSSPARRPAGGLALLARSIAPAASIEPLIEIIDIIAADADRPSVVLGPGEGGQPWLVGANGEARRLIEDLPWHDVAEAAALCARCTERGISVHVLPPATVVEAPEHVISLMDEVRRHPERAPRTAHFLVTRG